MPGISTRIMLRNFNGRRWSNVLRSHAWIAAVFESRRLPSATWYENAERNGRSYASAMSHSVSGVPDSLGKRNPIARGNPPPSRKTEIGWGSEIFFRNAQNADGTRNNIFFPLAKQKVKLHLRRHFKRDRYENVVNCEFRAWIVQSETRWARESEARANPILGIYTRANAPMRHRSRERLNIRHSIPAIINRTGFRRAVAIIGSKPTHPLISHGPCHV